MVGSRRENLLAIDLARHGLGHLEVNPIRWRWQCQFESSILFIAIFMPTHFTPRQKQHNHL